MTDLWVDERADGSAEAIAELARVATAHDGVAPFNDDTRLRLEERELVAAWRADALVAAALARRTDDGGLDAELVVHPALRGQGIGGQLVTALRRMATGPVTVWSHGRLSSATDFATEHGLTPVRTLLRLARPLTEADGDGPAEVPEGVALERFDAERDTDAFLALNARVFRDHPEQGALDRPGLDARRNESWYADEDFLLARDSSDGRLLGYNWLKLEDGDGEVYVIGVDDDAAGRGIGRALMAAGLARMHAAGMTRTSLYVEGDNERALRLYRSLGYLDDLVDVQYRA